MKENPTAISDSRGVGGVGVQEKPVIELVSGRRDNEIVNCAPGLPCMPVGMPPKPCNPQVPPPPRPPRINA